MPLDAIGEISVNSGNASAQYGNGLTSINVITKSGTNQWHGSAYEFIQNTAFNARGFFNQTISEVSRSELDEIAEHPGRAVTLTLYGISEGMQALQMCGGEKPAGLLTSRGEVWFPSSRGPVRININQPKPSEGAPVVVDQVVADGAQIPAGRGIALTPDTVKLELHYGAVLLRSQERVRFRYMLEGFDKNWNESTAERVATYTNLPAGRYRFRVAAFEMNNPEAIAETSLNLTQEPHFYRTIWFICLCMVAVAAMVWSVHRFRVGQLRVRFRAVLDERNRLAREMHDTLIQGCVSVSALLEAHSGLGHVEADAKQDLMNCARTQLRTTINEAREAVWDLRQTTDPAASLEPSLRKMTEEVSHEFGVPVDYQISGKPFDFHQETKHELLMIVREAIYNAVRHGRPGHILLDIEFEMNQCRVRVVDDGSGFDPEQIASRPAGHYGLICMRERVQRIGGRFALSSRSGGGTEITVQVPKRPVSSNVVRVGL
jgi:signal transduction histidine kinase